MEIHDVKTELFLKTKWQKQALHKTVLKHSAAVFNKDYLKLIYFKNWRS